MDADRVDKSNTFLIITASVLVFVILIKGVFSMSHNHAQPNDVLSEVFVNEIDEEILRYDGNTLSFYGYTQYRFELKSENAVGAGDEIKKIYNCTNEILKTDEYKNSPICIEVTTPHFDMGCTCIVVRFENFQSNDIEQVDDHISCVRGYGIDYEADMYVEGYHYELNTIEYWKYYDGVEQKYIESLRNKDNRESRYIKDFRSSQIQEVSNYIIGKYGDYIVIRDTNDRAEWYIDIYVQDIIGNSPYVNVWHLISSITKDTNEFLQEMNYSELQDRNMVMDFYLHLSCSDDTKTVRIAQFLNSYSDQTLKSFEDYFINVRLESDSLESVLYFEGLPCIDLSKLTSDEVQYVVDNFDGLRVARVADADTKYSINSHGVHLYY